MLQEVLFDESCKIVDSCVSDNGSCHVWVKSVSAIRWREWDLSLGDKSTLEILV